MLIAVLLGLFLALFVGYCLFSFKVIPAEYSCLILRFGKPIKVFHSGGLLWMRWPEPIIRVVLFPTERQQIDVPMQKIMTREGYDAKYLIKDDQGNLTDQLVAVALEDVERHDSQPINIDSVVFFSWPKLSEYLPYELDGSGKYKDKEGNYVSKEDIIREEKRAESILFEDLRRAYIEAPTPDNKELLAIFFQNAVIDIVREWASGHTWVECSSLLHEAAEELNKAVQNGLSRDQAVRAADIFKRARIKDVEFTFKEVILPAKLEGALGEREVGRREGDKQREIAKAEAVAITLKGEAEAEAEAAKVTQVAEAIRANPELGLAIRQLQTLEEMSKGEGTILAITPQVMEAVSNGLSTEKISALIRRLGNIN